MSSHDHTFHAPSVALLLLLLGAWSHSFGQENGRITGKVTDAGTGEPLIGISLVLMSTTQGASTDVDGTYTIRNVVPGPHDLRASGVGYAAKIIEHVNVIPGGTTILDIVLTQESVNLQEVVVNADEIRDTEASSLSQRKRSVLISDGISAEQIKRTPDATSGDALKRITGLSLIDNKFVFIRGITDRYNSTSLDGAEVTSTEAGKRSFSFDLVPANLLENTSVVKSATPDLPGDFSGGLVQLNTLDFPSSRVTKVSLSSSYNSATTSKDIVLSQGGSHDWMASDDGGRQLPSGTPDALSIARTASNNWAPRTQTAPYNSSFSLAIGDRTEFGSESEAPPQLGFVGALSYRNAYQSTAKIIDDFAVARYNVGAMDEYSVLWGAIANLSYKFGGTNKISFKNNLDRSAQDAVSQFLSRDGNTTLQNQYTIVNWTQRSAYTGQLTGEHVLTGLGSTTLQWRTALSSSAREDPDRKEVTYYRDLYDTTQPFTAAINRRSWAYMNERSASFAVDITVPLSSAKMKVGSLTQQRNTNYVIRSFDVTPDYFGGIPDSLTHLPLETIYAPDNFGKGKFLFGEASKASDAYAGDQNLLAGYVMLDLPVSVFQQKFRIVGGARYEGWEQNVNVPRTLSPDGPVQRAHLRSIDVLPSLNFTYAVTADANLRFAYSHSVNRPDFREMASTSYFDFIKYELVAGNPDLQRSFIHNYDVRLEMFPRAGEVAAVSFFKKQISDAIEDKLFETANRTRVPYNADAATNTGWEFELRKSFGFINGFLDNFSVVGNYTRVYSEVEFQVDKGNSSQPLIVHGMRPLQGQSPYTLNVSIVFTEPRLQTSVSVLYNEFGRRLETVGFLASDIYEEPRGIVDMALSQTLSNALELKFTIKNLTAKDRVLTRDGRVYEQSSVGRTYGLQISTSL